MIVRPVPVASVAGGGFSRSALFEGRGESDKTIAWRAGRAGGPGTGPARSPVDSGTTPSERPTAR